MVLILLMTLLITIDVIGRTLFAKSTLVADELSGYMMVAIVFLGLAHTLKADKHITVEIITSRLPDEKRQKLEVIVFILSAAFMAWLTWSTWYPVVKNLHTQSITSLHAPMWIPYLLVPVGSAMLTLAFLIEAVRKMKRLRRQ
jgi:TRAP-type C4-dicarboxylate transport system permease small subunit